MKKNQKYNVLSLCDGMSCGQIALVESGIKYDRYYASEIDKHCIKQTQLNFPDTIQLGDIEGWREWNIDWASICLILAGTPCTGFSFAGKMLNFDDPQSRLFLVFADILNHIRKINPGVLFLFENVRMKKECLRIISETLVVWPVLIDSALVSAQARKRYYWSNIRIRRTDLFNEIPTTDIPQPKDRGILLRDILEDNVDKKYFISDKKIQRITNCYKNYKPLISPLKAGCLTANYGTKQGLDRSATFIIPIEGKARTLRASTGGCSMDKKHNYQIIQLERGFNKGGIHEDKSPTVSANSFEQNNLVIQLNPSTESGGVQPYQQNRIYDVSGKSPALMSQMSCRTHAIKEKEIRRLTPTECARLQTVPAWYKWERSDTQIYRMLGNGWTIEVIKHIMGFLESNKRNK